MLVEGQQDSHLPFTTKMWFVFQSLHSVPTRGGLSLRIILFVRDSVAFVAGAHLYFNRLAADRASSALPSLYIYTTRFKPSEPCTFDYCFASN